MQVPGQAHATHTPASGRRDPGPPCAGLRRMALKLLSLQETLLAITAALLKTQPLHSRSFAGGWGGSGQGELEVLAKASP